VRRVERIQHLEVFEGCRKECVQESFLRLRVIRKLRKDKAFEIVEGQCREVVTWKFVRSVVSLHAGGRVPWRNTWSFAEIKEERTVGIL
jgi:hypothetical protein